MTDALLDVRAVSKSFEVKVIDDLSMAVAEGARSGSSAPTEPGRRR